MFSSALRSFQLANNQLLRPGSLLAAALFICLCQIAALATQRAAEQIRARVAVIQQVRPNLTQEKSMKDLSHLESAIAAAVEEHAEVLSELLQKTEGDIVLTINSMLPEILASAAKNLNA